jgi:hypothetical protein
LRFAAGSVVRRRPSGILVDSIETTHRPFALPAIASIEQPVSSIQHPAGNCLIVPFVDDFGHFVASMEACDIKYLALSRNKINSLRPACRWMEVRIQTSPFWQCGKMLQA